MNCTRKKTASNWLTLDIEIYLLNLKHQFIHGFHVYGEGSAWWGPHMCSRCEVRQLRMILNWEAKLNENFDLKIQQVKREDWQLLFGKDRKQQAFAQYFWVHVFDLLKDLYFNLFQSNQWSSWSWGSKAELHMIAVTSIYRMRTTLDINSATWLDWSYSWI